MDLLWTCYGLDVFKTAYFVSLKIINIAAFLTPTIFF
jgi:hypothetical protein